MIVDHITLLVEEPSVAALLENLAPQLLRGAVYDVHPFRGKQDMKAHLPARLGGYARWLPETYRIVVLMDRDDDDCRALKQEIDDMAQKAGLTSRSREQPGTFQIATRIAIEELESWYFGDWAAVCSAYPRVPHDIPRRSPYRTADAIAGGTWEAFERILQRAGYFAGGLRKIEAARTIAPHMDPGRNTSHSFLAFWSLLEELVAC
ncbi:MAG: DUF4276 family protein [Anaerolineae bacterium]